MREAEAAVNHLFDDVAYVLRLVVEHRGQIHRRAILRLSEEVAVRKAVAREAMISLHSVAPVVGKRHAVDADNFVARAPRPGSPHLEAGSEDDAIDLVFDAVRDHTGFRGALHASARAGVNQLDI